MPIPPRLLVLFSCRSLLADDLIIISPHQYNVNSFFKLFWNFLNFLFFHASTSFLDFFVPFLCINVQSNQLWLLFWTSSCLPSASTSNPTSFGFFFGLHRAYPLLQRPIRTALTSFLDFIVPSLHFNVQSNQPRFPFR